MISLSLVELSRIYYKDLAKLVDKYNENGKISLAGLQLAYDEAKVTIDIQYFKDKATILALEKGIEQ